MYNGVIDHLDTISHNTTIRKRNKRTVKKDLDTAVDSLVNETIESTAVLPIKKQETEKTNIIDSIPDFSKVEKIKKRVVITKPENNFEPPKKKKREAVWL